MCRCITRLAPTLLLLSTLLFGACGAAQAIPERPVLGRSADGATDVVTVSAVPIPTVTHKVEMPWIWRVLRSEVYRRLPRVKSQDRRFAAVVSPVIVDGPYDSVPGVGLEGGF